MATNTPIGNDTSEKGQVAFIFSFRLSLGDALAGMIPADDHSLFPSLSGQHK